MIDTIVDVNHRGQPDFSALVSAGITAVIHKATEGATFQDPEFASRRSARSRVLLKDLHRFGEEPSRLLALWRPTLLSYLRLTEKAL